MYIYMNVCVYTYISTYKHKENAMGTVGIQLK